VDPVCNGAPRFNTVALALHQSVLIGNPGEVWRGLGTPVTMKQNCSRHNKRSEIVLNFALTHLKPLSDCKDVFTKKKTCLAWFEVRSVSVFLEQIPRTKLRSLHFEGVLFVFRNLPRTERRHFWHQDWKLLYFEFAISLLLQV
jgi:hypothetical protein